MKLKTVFFCGHNSRYGLAHLEPVLRAGFEIQAIVLATPARWERFWKALTGRPRTKPALWRRLRAGARELLKRSSSSPEAVVRQLAEEANVPVWRADNVNAPAFLRRLSALSPHLLLSAAYPQIFSRELLKVPRFGAVNFHPSLLPRFRGAHPHYWAIAKGEKTGGLTAHFMTPEVDKGDIVEQVSFPIGRLNYNEHYDVIVGETATLVHKVAAFFLHGKRKGRPQGEEGACYFSNDRDEDHRIQWSEQTAEEICHLIRTLRAVCQFEGKPVNPRKAFFLADDQSGASPGKVVAVAPGGIVVQARQGRVVLEVVRNGREDTAAAAWAGAAGVRSGSCFE